MFLNGISWKEAVIDILEYPKENIPTYNRSRSEKNEMPLLLPAKNSSARNVIAYLCATRKIDYDLVVSCLKGKLLYQDLRKNCVFVGYDKDGNVKHAHLKGTNPDKTFMKDIEGSDKRFSFSIIGNTGTIFVFESPLDLLSYMSLQKKIGSNLDDNYIALYGTSNLRLMQFLNDYPQMKEIVLCLDNDVAGEKGTQIIMEELKNKHGDKYEIKIDKPQLKDFNDDLIYALQTKTEVQSN